MSAPISADRERELIARWKQGDRDAGAALLAANESLLWKLVGIRSHPSRRDDAMQVARMGLLRAALKYDPSEGYRLAAYAGKWARGESLKYTYEDTTIAVGYSAVAKARAIERAGQPLPERRALEMRLRSTWSLDAPIDGADGQPLPTLVFADAIASGEPTSEDLLDAPLADRRRRALIGQALDALTERERDVIQRSELADDTESLADIARSMGLSRERVRQVHDQAMRKLERALRWLVTTEDAALWGGRRRMKKAA